MIAITRFDCSRAVGQTTRLFRTISNQDVYQYSAPRAHPSLLKCEDEYLVSALGKESAAQAVVGYWALRVG